MARRLGSASAAKTLTETSSGSGRKEGSQLVELGLPAADVALVADSHSSGICAKPLSVTVSVVPLPVGVSWNST